MLRIGTQKIKELRIGTLKIKEAWVGATKVFSSIVRVPLNGIIADNTGIHVSYSNITVSSSALTITETKTGILSGMVKTSNDTKITFYFRANGSETRNCIIKQNGETKYSTSISFTSGNPKKVTLPLSNVTDGVPFNVEITPSSRNVPIFIIQGADLPTNVLILMN